MPEEDTACHICLEDEWRHNCLCLLPESGEVVVQTRWVWAIVYWNSFQQFVLEPCSREWGEAEGADSYKNVYINLWPLHPEKSNWTEVAERIP